MRPGRKAVAAKLPDDQLLKGSSLDCFSLYSNIYREGTEMLQQQEIQTMQSNLDQLICVVLERDEDWPER